MPILRSAKKALRQNLRRRARNKRIKEEIKKLIKEARSSGGKMKAEEVRQFLSRIFKVLDKAAKEGVIKQNTAARKKSRIAKFLQKVGAL